MYNDRETPMKRCPWCEGFELYRDYHDTEWGVPVRDDRTLFELLILEGAQAGLSWSTVLKKRENYREAFDDFNPEKIAQYGDAKVLELLTNPGIIRNKLKITFFNLFFFMISFLLKNFFTCLYTPDEFFHLFTIFSYCCEIAS